MERLYTNYHHHYVLTLKAGHQILFFWLPYIIAISAIVFKCLIVKSCPSASIRSCIRSLSLCSMAEPKLIVFDLDYTLWPFWVDTHVDPPFRKTSDGKVYDSHQQQVKYYKDVPEILSHLHKSGFQLGIASRTSAVAEANDLTRLFNWDQFFHFRQIYPGSKITHFKKLHSLSGVAYRDMLFFDDEHRNIVDVSTLGVTALQVDAGLNVCELALGMEIFEKNSLSQMEKRRKKKNKKSKRPSSQNYDYDKFDDDSSSSSSFSRVTCMFVPDGISQESFRKGLELFKEQNKEATKK